MTAGGIRRRCRCRDENGKDLGARCPKLQNRTHGTWQLRHELPPDRSNKRRMFRRFGFGTKSEAQNALDTLRRLLDIADDEDDREAITQMILALKPKEPLPDPEDVRRRLRAGQPLGDRSTVANWLDDWFAQEKGQHRRNTEVLYESHIRLYLKPKIGHIRLDRLTVNHLVEMFNSIEDDNDAIVANNDDRRTLLSQIKATRTRTQKGLLRAQLAALPSFRRPVGPTSQQRILGTIRAALNDAIAQQRLTFNPAVHFSIPAKRPKPLIWTSARIELWRRTGTRPGPVMVWTPEQAGAFLDHVAEHDPDYEALWHIAVVRGLRRGELAGLGWTEVHLDSASLQVLTQLTEVRYQIEEGPPKSTAGTRTIPLDAESVRLLHAHRKRQARARLELGAAWTDSGKVFAKPDGTPLRPSWIGDRFKQLYTTAGLPPVRLHDLRHVAATLMLAASVDLKVIQETLGHSALSTTSDLYTSVLPELATAAADATLAVLPRRAPRRTRGHPSGTHTIAARALPEGADTDESEKPQVDGGLTAV